MTDPIKIFIAYSGKDQSDLEKLKHHLHPYEMSGKVELSAYEVPAQGNGFGVMSLQALQQAYVVVVLVSAESLMSDFFYGNELKDAIDRSALGGSKLLPVILHPCSWQETALAGLEAFPENGLPISKWPDVDEGFHHVAQAIEQIVSEKALLQLDNTSNSPLGISEKGKPPMIKTSIKERLQHEKGKEDDNKSSNTAPLPRPTSSVDNAIKKNWALAGSLLLTSLLGLLYFSLQQSLLPVKIPKFELTQISKPAILPASNTETNNIGDIGANDKLTGIDAGSESLKGTSLSTKIKSVQSKDLTNNNVPGNKVSKAGIDPFEGKKIYVAGGTFERGSNDGIDQEKPLHSVTVSSFYIGRTEVTQAQWNAIMSENPSQHKDCDDCPVENVSWDDVQAYLKMLNAKTGKNYRLPTEAEWEFVARGGNKSIGYIYSGSNTVGDVAWYHDNSSGYTHPVGKKRANELGIYDMSGNVFEWCEDWYWNYSASTQTNPEVFNTGSDRVVRGGGSSSSAHVCRSTHRSKFAPKARFRDLGFRIALSK